jgi:transposase-like protein
MPGGGNTKGYSKSSGGKAAKRWDIANRRRMVALLLNSGLNQAQVAEALGVSAGTVSEDGAAIEEGLRQSARLSLAEKMAREEQALVEDEVAVRLEMAEARTTSARLRIHDHVLAIMRRRSELLGLDAQERRKQKEMEAGQEGLDELLARVLAGEDAREVEESDSSEPEDYTPAGVG